MKDSSVLKNKMHRGVHTGVLTCEGINLHTERYVYIYIYVYIYMYLYWRLGANPTGKAFRFVRRAVG